MGTHESSEACPSSILVGPTVRWLVVAVALAVCMATLAASARAQGPEPGAWLGEVTPEARSGSGLANTLAGDLASNDGVCIYEHPNYGGAEMCFIVPGGYADFANFAVDNIASSIRFEGSYGGGKYVATLYEHPNYGGAWTAFGADDANISDDEIGDNRASSIKIQTVPQCTGNGVYLYENSNYAGRCRKFTNSYSDLRRAGFDDIASSVRLVGSYGGRLYKVTLCEHPNYSGTCSIFTSDDSDLVNWPPIGDDRTSSVRIETACNYSGDGVYLYEYMNYGGRCWRWTGSDSDFGNENFNDIASSIRFVGSYAGGKYVATLYENVYYHIGAWTAFGADDGDFGNDKIGDNRASSIKIQTVPQCTGNGVYLYENSNYAGRCRKFRGSYSDLRRTGFNDIASSVRLVGTYGGGLYKVTLCQHANYGGTCSSFTSDDSDLGNNSIGHDRTSSVRIKSAVTTSVLQGSFLLGTTTTAR
jgi:hypothetical protein